MIFFGVLGEPRGVALVDTSSSHTETVDFGEDTAGRWIVILAFGGNNNTTYNMTATIAGSPGTVIVNHSSGDGAGIAVGSAIIVGQPSGTSGTVTLGDVPSGGARFFVLRVVGYDLSAAVFSDDSTGNSIPPWDVEVPAGGLVIGIDAASNEASNLNWTGLTERSSTTAVSTSCAIAWDVDMAADAAKEIECTNSDDDGASSSCIASFAPV